MISTIIRAAATIAATAIAEGRARTRAIVLESRLAQAECEMLRLKHDLATALRVLEREAAAPSAVRTAIDSRSNDAGAARLLVEDGIMGVLGWDVDDLRDVEREDGAYWVAVRVRVPCDEVERERRRRERVKRTRSAR